MSLKNETRETLNKTRAFYREYTKGMTPERIGREFHDDSRRIMELYNEAVGISRTDDPERVTDVKPVRLISSLLARLTPTRRLALGVSLAGLVFHFALSGPLATIMLPASFAILLLLLLLELLEKSDVKKEIDLARDIQISLLPDSCIKHDSLDFASFASTASEVGGDYVDVIHTSTGTYYFIADVSGKGLAAALYMARLQALVHFIIEKLQPDPKELLCHLNDYIKSGKKDRTFVTACCAFFSKNGGHVKICRAGHNAPLFYDAEHDIVSELCPSGLALGMTNTPTFQKNLHEISLSVNAGDHLLFYTDGLTEARNSCKEQYGEHRLYKLFEIYGSLESGTILKKIHMALEEFVGGEKLLDDITFTCIERVSEKTPLRKKEPDSTENS